MNYVSSNIIVALLTYAYASLRKYAAKTPGKYKGESAILKNEPVKAALVYGFVKENIDILKTEEEFQGEDGLFALKQLLLLISNIDGATAGKNSGELVVFNDKNPEQICYGITLNRVNPLYGQTKNQKRYFQNHQGFYGTYAARNILFLGDMLFYLFSSHSITVHLYHGNKYSILWFFFNTFFSRLPFPG